MELTSLAIATLRKLKYDVKQDVCCTIDITYSADFDLECCLGRFRLESCKAEREKKKQRKRFIFHKIIKIVVSFLFHFRTRINFYIFREEVEHLFLL